MAAKALGEWAIGMPEEREREEEEELFARSPLNLKNRNNSVRANNNGYFDDRNTTTIKYTAHGA